MRRAAPVAAMVLSLIAALGLLSVWHWVSTTLAQVIPSYIEEAPLSGSWITLRHHGQVITAAAGQVLTVALDAHPSTGRTWAFSSLDPSLVAVIDRRFLPHTDLEGAPGTEVIRLVPRAQGRTTLALRYARPWAPVPPVAPVFDVELVVEGRESWVPRSFTDSSPSSPEPDAATMADGGEESAGIRDPILSPASSESLPAAFDWRALGGVTPVRDQGDACGSCWAFATVAVMESALKIGGGPEVDLSEQYLIAHNEEGWGCHGGGTAHDYHVWRVPWGQREPGAVAESECATTSNDAPCPGPHPLRHPYLADGWAYVENNVPAIKAVLHRYGPVKVSLCAGPAFAAYTGDGVFETDETAYCGGGVNHAVVLVGWDDGAGTAGAWIARNAWGAGWGDGGYVTIGYGVSNVGTAASYLVYDGLPVERWDQTGGNAAAVDLAVPYAYVGTGARLVVLDISGPSPLPIGESDPVFDGITGVTVAGIYAYVTDRVRGLTVVDVSDPGAPAVVGRYPFPDAQGVVLSGTLAYLVGGGTLTVLDVGDSAAPLFLGSVGTGGTALGVDLAGTYAYIAGGSAGLAVVDVAEPASPTLAGTLDVGGTAYDVDVLDHVAYVAHESGLRVIDVADPTAPEARGGLDRTETAHSVAVSGTLAFAALDPGGLWVVDVTDPNLPGEVGYLELGGAGRDVALLGALAYVASGGLGLRVIDVNTPTAPVEGDPFQPLGDVVDIASGGDLAYLAAGELGVRVVSATTAAPVMLGAWDDLSFDSAVGVELVGSTLYVAGITSLRVLDVSSPSAPVEIGGSAASPAWDVAVEGGYAYVAGSCSQSINYGISVYDVTDPASPIQIYNPSVSGCADKVQIAGGYLYVLAEPLDAGFNPEPGGLSIFDLATPEVPVWVASIAMDPPPENLALGDGYAYLAAGDGVHVLDLADPAAPVAVAALPSGAGAVTWVDHVLYAAGDGGLWAYAVQTPTEAALVGRWGPGFAAHTLIARDGYAWAGPRDRGGLERLRLLRDRVYAYVPPGGGVVSSKGAVATLDFPAATFDAEAAVALRHLMQDPVLVGHQPVARTFDLDAVDHTTGAPVTANLAYTAVVTYASGAAPGRVPVLYAWDGNAWTPAPGAEDAATSRVSGTLDAVAPFALLGVQPPLSVGLVAPTEATLGTTVLLTATALPVTATLPLTFTWHADGQAVRVERPVSTVSGISLTWLSPGTQVVTVTATNVGGDGMATHTITITDVPIAGLAMAHDGPTVLGWSTTLTATVSDGTNVAYDWDFGDDAAAAGSVVSHTYRHGGVFDVSVLAANTAGSTSAADQVRVLTPTVALGQAAALVAEDGGAVALPVLLDVAAGVPVTVDCTVGGSALAGTDYTMTVGALTFPPGTTALTLTVDIRDDVQDEEDETICVRLVDPLHAVLGEPATATLTLVDDDPPPALWLDDVVVEEDAGIATAAFPLRLSTSSGRVVTVDYATADGTARAGSDYTAISGTLIVSPGLSSLTLAVPVLGDVLHELTETFSVYLSNPVHSVVLDGAGVATIRDDDDPPSLWIADAAVWEGDYGASLATFTVTLTGSTAQTVTVGYTTGGGNASPGDDYAPATGELVWPPGDHLRMVSVAVYGDLLDEVDELFRVELADPANALIGDDLGWATIRDDDTALLHTRDVTVTEGDAGTTTAAVPVTLTVPSSRPITVSYATYDGNALAGIDYLTSQGNLVVAAGETSATVPVSVLGDALDEEDAWLVVRFDEPHNVTLGSHESVVRILDDDVPPVVAIAGASTMEGDAGTTDLDFAVTLSDPSGRAVTVTYAVQPGSASPGLDYTPVSGTLSFDPGETATVVPVSVLGDTQHEGDEAFSVTLSSPVHASLGTASALGTIYNDDEAPCLWMSDAQVVEGAASGMVTATLAVTLTGESGQVVTADYATVDGAAVAGADYVYAAGTLVWYPGDDVQRITLTVLGDDLDEEDESFRVSLDGVTNADLGDPDGAVTIVDDDVAVLHIPDVTVTEGDAGTTIAAVPVTLTVPSSRPITVSYATYDGDALAGLDYGVVQGYLYLAAGETSATLPVPVVGDTLDEDDETFGVAWSDPHNVVLGASGAAVYILDDDPLAAVSIDDAAVAEGDGGTADMLFDVALSAASGKPVTVTYATQAGSAHAGSDYTPVGGTLVLTPGLAVRTLSVPVVGDEQHEAHETLSVTLSNPVNATLLDGVGRGTILNDDDPPQLWLADAGIGEGDDGVASATFTVTLAGSTAQTVTVDYATGGGTAWAGLDYRPLTGTLAWSPGEFLRVVRVAVYGDRLDEDDETFGLSLTNPVGAGIERAHATGTIVDDDTTALYLGDAEVVEGDAGLRTAVVPVTLSLASSRYVTVSCATHDRGALAGVDYEATQATLALAPGVRFTTCPIPVTGDRLDEDDETLGVRLSHPVNAPVARPAALLRILDDDDPPAAVLHDAVTWEGDEGVTALTFTVTLSVPSGRTITLTYQTQDGTAQAGSDYTATGGALPVASGVVSTTLVVPVLGDAWVEPDETLTVTLTGGQHVTLDDARAIGTILDDDADDEVGDTLFLPLILRIG